MKHDYDYKGFKLEKPNNHHFMWSMTHPNGKKVFLSESIVDLSDAQKIVDDLLDKRALEPSKGDEESSSVGEFTGRKALKSLIKGSRK
jgi:hypothetical protein